MFANLTSNGIAATAILIMNPILERFDSFQNPVPPAASYPHERSEMRDLD
jgi:hypothetical protein